MNFSGAKFNQSSDICIYIYYILLDIYMCVCVYMCIYVYVLVYVYAYIYIYIYIYIYVFLNYLYCFINEFIIKPAANMV